MKTNILFDTLLIYEFMVGEKHIVWTKYNGKKQRLLFKIDEKVNWNENSHKWLCILQVYIKMEMNEGRLLKQQNSQR